MIPPALGSLGLTGVHCVVGSVIVASATAASAAAAAAAAAVITVVKTFQSSS